MRFNLYEFTIQRQDHTAHGFVVAPTQDAAWLTVIEHEEALGLEHEDLTFKRIDDVIDDGLRKGLDELLTNAPVGFASYSGIGWVAHTAPVQQLKLYRTLDDNGGSIFAIAPNVDIAATIFTIQLKVPRGEMRRLHISDGMADMPEDMVRNLPQLLELGPVGVAEFNEEHDRWIVL